MDDEYGILIGDDDDDNDDNKVTAAVVVGGRRSCDDVGVAVVAAVMDVMNEGAINVGYDGDTNDGDDDTDDDNGTAIILFCPLPPEALVAVMAANNGDDCTMG
jgi:hypothetical protein